MPLKKGRYDIPVPQDQEHELVPTVILAPLLAFDMEGYRLGYGGGYYDRMLAARRKQGNVIVVGLAFDIQRVDMVPRDPHDERLDWVLTQSGPHQFGDAST